MLSPSLCRSRKPRKSSPLFPPKVTDSSISPRLLTLVITAPASETDCVLIGADHRICVWATGLPVSSGAIPINGRMPAGRKLDFRTGGVRSDGRARMNQRDSALGLAAITARDFRSSVDRTRSVWITSTNSNAMSSSQAMDSKDQWQRSIRASFDEL
jgi:hypothetical protein